MDDTQSFVTRRAALTGKYETRLRNHWQLELGTNSTCESEQLRRYMTGVAIRGFDDRANAVSA